MSKPDDRLKGHPSGGTDEADPAEPGRREALSKLGSGIVAAALGLPLVISARSLVPNALYEQPRRFKAGKPERFAQGPTFLTGQKVFVFREGSTFHCIGATCTHLGCTVQLVRTGKGAGEGEIEFHCPCHGSKFRGDGTNYAGPAPRPLDYYSLSLAPDDGQLVVDVSEVEDKGWRFTV